MENVSKRHRERSQNWDSSDKILLQQLIEEKIKIIEDKRVDTNTSKAKREAWKEILSSFNQCSNTKRDVCQIQNQWRNTKMHAKKRASTYKKERGATGGGAAPKSPDPETERLMALIPEEFTVDHNLFDSDTVDNEILQINMEEEYLLEDFQTFPSQQPATLQDDPVNLEKPLTPTPLNDTTNFPTSTSKKKCKKSTNNVKSDDYFKDKYLEEQTNYLRKKFDEELETFRLDRVLKERAFEAEERRKEEEHQLLMKNFSAEHNLRLKHSKEFHQQLMKNMQESQSRLD